MKIKPNPLYRIFFEHLEKLKSPFAKWEGVAYRAAPLEFARVAKLLDGNGSFQFGGRWSAPGAFCAVNLSLSQEVAVRESAANGCHYNFAAEAIRPKVLVSVRITTDKLIDCRILSHLRATLMSKIDIGEDWRKENRAGRESQSQAFGRAVHDLAAEALIVPSTRVPSGLNLIYFPGPSVKPPGIEILGKKELERGLKTR